jgi:hypothetical protein
VPHRLHRNRRSELSACSSSSTPSTRWQRGHGGAGPLGSRAEEYGGFIDASPVGGSYRGRVTMRRVASISQRSLASTSR